MRLPGQTLTLAWLVLALLVAGFVYECHKYARDARFNTALREARLGEAGEHPSPRGKLARAVALQRDGDSAAALAAYAELDTADAPELDNTRRYNLGLIWLAQAAEREAQDEAELGVPLVELAKQAWRDVLRTGPNQPGAWDARHNLGQALQMLPDIESLDADDERMPERSPRAPQATRAIDRLP